MDDQCALGPDGRLLDVSEIVWHHDPDDAIPIQVPSTSMGSTGAVQEGGSCETGTGAVIFFSFFFTVILTRLFILSELGLRSRPVRATAGARLAEAIAAERLDEFGNTTSSTRRLNPSRVLSKRKRLSPDANGVDSDPEDKTFGDTDGGSDDNDDPDTDVMEIGNKEVR